MDNNVVDETNEFSKLKQNFDFERILSNDPKQKSAAILLKQQNGDEKCVIHLVKTGFDAEDLMQVKDRLRISSTVFTNPPFFSYDATWALPTRISSTVIHPASDGIIKKYTHSPIRILDESYEMYLSRSLKYFESQIHNNQWVYNILEGRSEVQRLLLKSENFLLVADLKWDMKDTKDAYIIAILTRRDIYSLRQLNASLLPILIEIRDSAKMVMKTKYGFEDNQIQLYVHYLPSFYHFHVHINLSTSDRAGLNIGRAHYLDQIIQNIKMDANYYQKYNLLITVPEDHPLFQIYSIN